MPKVLMPDGLETRCYSATMVLHRVRKYTEIDDGALNPGIGLPTPRMAPDNLTAGVTGGIGTDGQVDGETGKRVTGDDDEPGNPLVVWCTGYAGVYAEVEQADWTEYMMPGAFDKTLVENPDVVSFWNHNADNLLGRTSSGTLQLQCDAHGLKYYCNLPMETHLGQYVAAMCDRRDITGASIQFLCDRETWDFSTDPPKRYMHEVRLYEAGPVYQPAQPLATIGLGRMQFAKQLLSRDLRAHPDKRIELLSRELGTGKQKSSIQLRHDITLARINLRRQLCPR